MAEESELPDALWVEPDGTEIIIHNGAADLNGLIATGYLSKFIRADIHDALVKAADELALSLSDCMETLPKPDDIICCSGRECGCYGATIHQQSIHYATEALTAYRKARGETQ